MGAGLGAGGGNKVSGLEFFGTTLSGVRDWLLHGHVRGGALGRLVQFKTMIVHVA